MSKKWWRVLFILEILVSALILFLVSYITMIWWVVILGSLLVVIFGTFKKNLIDGRWIILPMFFLVVALFFVILKPQINLPVQQLHEISLSQSANLAIDLQALKEKSILGSGPGTFSYDFARFKDLSINKSSLWNVPVNRGTSKVLNDLATTGILGILALFALMIYPVFCGLKFIITEKIYKNSASKTGFIPKTDQVKIVDGLMEERELAGYKMMAFGLLVYSAVGALIYFLYNSNVVLDFVYFFFISGLIGLIAKGKKEYNLRSSSLLNLIVTFIFTLLFILGVGAAILYGQRYIAEINYAKGISDFQAGKIDSGIKNIEIAAGMDPSSDVYFRELSSAYSLKLQNDVQNLKSAPTSSDTKSLQALAANSINAAQIAIKLDPNNYNNWETGGDVYQGVSSVLSGTGTWANKSYDMALKLNSDNPYLLAQEGIVFYSMANGLPKDQLQQANQFLSQAAGRLEKAVGYVPNYSNAIYYLGLTYSELGDKAKAILEFEQLQKLNPDNSNIQQILNNLNNPAATTKTATRAK